MSVIYNTAVIDARLQVVVDAIDAGSGSGKLKIGIAGMGLILSTIVFSKPCATISSGVLTISNVPLTDAYAAATGTAAAARIEDSTGVVVASGLTVGLSTSFDITISKTNISMGDIVVLVSGTITGH